ncbi:hypothetical protein D9619_013619 [Psilocybe cf. subviscida]|uniref:Phytocyanin domain-containing protein n=1 Tax=Psilocybe cf. subviscida TaxID=2480587 RepID=A0A8H5F9F9_9AGAR|nr:hypothetical protein D9619_013619 [Psilocybe cf. subviscida]
MLFAASLSSLALATCVVAQLNPIIRVGGEATDALGPLQFGPPQIPEAPLGTVITFEFIGEPGNHSVTQSSFTDPCNPLPGGFDSGWVFIPQAGLGPPPTFNLTITDDNTPIWFYCKQLQPSPHCIAGMVGAINAPVIGSTFDQFQKNAEAFKGIPGALTVSSPLKQSEGALVGIGASASAGIVGIPSGATAFPITASASGGLATQPSSVPSATPARTSNIDTSGSSSEATAATLPAAPSAEITHNSAQTATAGKSPPRIVSTGAIAGGVVGGFIIVVLVIFLLWFRTREIKPHTEAAYNNMASLVSPAGSHTFHPYTLPRIATDLEPLKSKQKLMFSAIETTSPHSAVPAANMTVTAEHSADLLHVQRLRLERERINRELASLDQISEPGSNHSDGSVDGGRSTTSLRTNQRLLAEQLAELQRQMVQVEERQQHMQSDLPPYDGVVP